MRLNNHTVSKDIKVMGCLKLYLGLRRVMVGNTEVYLTGLEFNLLHLMMAHWPNLLSRTTISTQLFQEGANNDRAMNIHISNLRKKLLKYSSGLNIQSLRGQGYYLLVKESK